MLGPFPGPHRMGPGHQSLRAAIIHRNHGTSAMASRSASAALSAGPTALSMSNTRPHRRRAPPRYHIGIGIIALEDVHARLSIGALEHPNAARVDPLHRRSLRPLSLRAGARYPHFGSGVAITSPRPSVSSRTRRIPLPPRLRYASAGRPPPQVGRYCGAVGASSRLSVSSGLPPSMKAATPLVLLSRAAGTGSLRPTFGPVRRTGPAPSGAT